MKIPLSPREAVRELGQWIGQRDISKTAECGL